MSNPILPTNPATGQLPTAEEIRAILAQATVYNAAGIAAAAVRLNQRALEFAAQLPPVEQQIAMQYVAEAEVAQCGRVAFCAAARAALRLHGPARLASGQGYALVTKYVKMGA